MQGVDVHAKPHLIAGQDFLEQRKQPLCRKGIHDNPVTHHQGLFPPAGLNNPAAKEQSYFFSRGLDAEYRGVDRDHICAVPDDGRSAVTRSIFSPFITDTFLPAPGVFLTRPFSGAALNLERSEPAFILFDDLGQEGLQPLGRKRTQAETVMRVVAGLLVLVLPGISSL